MAQHLEQSPSRPAPVILRPQVVQVGSGAARPARRSRYRRDFSAGVSGIDGVTEAGDSVLGVGGQLQ